jgi:hypothetical protein
MVIFGWCRVPSRYSSWKLDDERLFGGSIKCLEDTVEANY